MFSLYINDLQHILKVEGDDNRRTDKADKLQHIFYADDLQIYLRMSINEIEGGVAALKRMRINFAQLFFFERSPLYKKILIFYFRVKSTEKTLAMLVEKLSLQ